MIKKQKPFMIDYKSEIDDRNYTGQFVTKKLSVMDSTKISVRKSQLSGGMYCVRDENGNPTGQGIDEDTDTFNYMLAMLEICLIQKPEWWKLSANNSGDDNYIGDQGLISAVFAEVISFEKSFRGRNGSANQGQGSGARSEIAGAPEPSSSDSANNPKKVVGGEVQSALDA